MKKQSPSLSKNCVNISSISIKEYWYYIVGVILLIILALVIAYNYDDKFNAMVKSTFQNVSSGGSSSSVANDIKDLDVVFFMKPSCPYCQNMMKIFQKEGTLNLYKIVNAESEEGEKLVKMFGVDSFPSFISIKLKTGTKGEKDSSKTIVTELKNVKPPEKFTDQGSPEINQIKIKIKELNIIMFKSDNCGHCKKMLETLRSNDLDSLIHIVDIQSPEAMKLLNEFGITADEGVPMFYSVTLKKKVIGARPVDQLINEFTSG